ncbi:hypothetical protein [Amycolatopsis sp. NBC_01286]|uniref:hypothetical protein n=1 Tax=Amycolatopsis sp. NBC_01286 TaxID=2903560 RepID=UPI002E145F5C|nr:hypothetical protein OG570_00200 [Amycolatopsis sp. NBC_01286]
MGELPPSPESGSEDQNRPKRRRKLPNSRDDRLTLEEFEEAWFALSDVEKAERFPRAADNPYVSPFPDRAAAQDLLGEDEPNRFIPTSEELPEMQAWEEQNRQRLAKMSKRWARNARFEALQELRARSARERIDAISLDVPESTDPEDSTES